MRSGSSRIAALLLALLPGIALAELPQGQWTASIAPQTEEVLPGGVGPETLQFGEAVALEGRLAASGMPAYGQGRGRVAVFRRNDSGEWIRSATLEAPDAIAGDAFGLGVVVRQQHILVSSTRALHVFARGRGWQEIQRLPVDANEWFTAGIDSAGPWLAIGAAALDAPGAVYVYRINSGGRLHRHRKLLAPTGSAAEDFGASVAVWRGTIVVGAPGYNGTQGAAYVYRHAGGLRWIAQQLVNPNGQPNDAFGAAVDVRSNVVVVGAPGEERVSPQNVPVEYLAQGAVHVFDRQGAQWLQAQRIRPTPDQHSWYGNFGGNVQLSGTRLAVAAPFGSHYADPGHIFLYTRTAAGYEAEQFLTGEASVGSALHLSTSALIAGAPWDPFYSIGYGLIYELPATR